MADKWNDFRRFEEMMNRMFEEFWGRPSRQFINYAFIRRKGRECAD